MCKPTVLFIIALGLTSATAEVQQGTSSVIQQTKAEVSLVPCTATHKVPNWLHIEKLPIIKDGIDQLQKSGGGVVDVKKIIVDATKPKPCPTVQVPTTKSKQTSALPSLAIPPTAITGANAHANDAVKPASDKTTIRCDFYDPDGKGLPLFFPSPDDYAVPASATTPEFDDWSGDLEVKLSCHALKRDKATGRYFVVGK